MKHLIEELNQLMTQGDHKKVIQKIRSLNIKSIPDEHRHSLAKISNRAKAPYLALKILKNIVRGDFEKSPHDLSVIQYCQALNQIGSFAEAQKLFESIKNCKEPDYFRYRGFSYIYSWDYDSAYPYLVRYLKTCEDQSYNAVVGHLNCIAALLNAELFELSSTHIKEAYEIIHALQLENSVLEGNLLELRAQLEFFTGETHAALETLSKAKRIFANHDSIYGLFVEKWESIIKLSQNTKAKKDQRHILSLRRKMEKRNHWESLREIDLYCGIYLKDPQLIAKVFLGTPFESYKRRVRKMIDGKFEIPQSYLWSPNQSKDPSIIDLEKVNFKGKKMTPLVNSNNLLNLLKILTQDLYRPVNLGSIYNQLFPNEYFDPYHSPDRIHQTIRRLRMYLETQSRSIKVLYSPSGYKLSLGRGLALKLYQSSNQYESKTKHELHLLLTCSPNDEWTAQKVQEWLKCSRKKATRVIKLGLETGQIIRVGQGKNTRYKVAA